MGICYILKENALEIDIRSTDHTENISGEFVIDYIKINKRSKGKMTRILFQGDSITDCGRSRDGDGYVGNGYVNHIKATLGFEHPGEYEVLNRAVSGNRVVDLYARIKADLINLKPDVLSIHIGINDVWHEVETQNGVDAEKFEGIYDMLLSEVKAALPNLKIILLGAFVTKGRATESAWDVFETETAKRAASTRRLAEKYGGVFVDMQAEFDKAVARHPEPYWTYEGVHPAEAGNELIKRVWLEAFEKIK